MYWKKLPKAEIEHSIQKAFERNAHFGRSKSMGLPLSSMDPSVFPTEHEQHSPFLRALWQNVDHSGCPTLGVAGDSFEGTKELENETIHLCAEQLLKGKPGKQDGYVSAGGTESNIQAVWIYRNLFKQKFKAHAHQIALLHSEDTHYSLWKVANLLGIRQVVVPVDRQSRKMERSALQACVTNSQEMGISFFIVVANMGTTMFGTVDDIDMITSVLDKTEVYYKVHVDAAFGGFIYPFLQTNNRLNFANSKVTSISLDAHKMLQAPYGTGMFLIRKGYLHYLDGHELRFMAHKAHTLSGSRSGANAISIWIILRAFGSRGLKSKVRRIMRLKKKLCDFLDARKIEYVHDPHMNIVAIHHRHLLREIQQHYYLVPDNHDNPTWWKVVLMDHVSETMMQSFLDH